MKLRMTVATGLAVLCLAAVSACTEDTPGEPDPTQATPTQTDDSEESGPPVNAENLIGQWEDADAQWAVTFNEDGTFSEDYQGLTGFRTGEYVIDDTTVSLVGGDGNTDKGTIEGQSIKFALGTLTRK